MKLPRKRFIAAGLLLVILGGGVYGLKLYLESEKRLEHIVIQAVSPYIKGSFQVGRVKLGFFSAHLNEVNVQLPAQAVAISVEDIRVSFSPVKLFLSGFSVARSIAKIVLIGPTIDILMAANAIPDLPRPSDANSPGKVSQSLVTVEFLNVKNGTIRLKDRRGQIAVLGEHLQGRMWESGTGLNYNLTGKLGALRRNLFVSGRISWQGEQHRLSLQLDRAEIRRPLVFKDIAVTSGELSGVLEFAFPDNATFASVESNGWMRINHGTFRIGKNKKKTFNSVDLSLSVAGTTITLDSLFFKHCGATLKASGTWDLAGKSRSDRIGFQCRNIWLDSLGLLAARDFCRAVGTGWVQGTLERAKGSDASLTMNCGGITIWGKPLLSLYTHLKLQHRQVELDSCVLHSPAVDFVGKGILDYSREPVVYGFQGKGIFNSLAFINPKVQGKAQFSADLNGVGSERSGQISVKGDSIRYTAFPLGRIDLKASVKGDSGVFFFKNKLRGCKIEAGGIINRPFTDHSWVLCTLLVKVNAKSPFYSGGASHIPRPDSMKVMAFFGGGRDTFQVISAVYIHDRKVNGGISLRCNRRFSPIPVPVEWQLEPLNLCIGGSSSACNGSGRLYKDSLIIDSLALFDRAIFSGKMLRNKHPTVAIECKYDVGLKNIAALLMKSSDAVEGGTVNGTMRFSGPLDKIESRAEVHARRVRIGGVGMLETDAAMTGSGNAMTVLPFVIRKDGSVIAAIDTIRNAPHLFCSGKLYDCDLETVFGALFPEETEVEGRVTASFRSSDSGFPVVCIVSSPHFSINGRQFDSANAVLSIDFTGLRVSSLHASDGARSVITATGFLPVSFLRGEENEKDTMRAAITARGDLIASFHHNVSAVINGSGQGSLSICLENISGSWRVGEGSLLIPKGDLIFKPYIPGPVKAFSCRMDLKDSSSVTVLMSGITAGKRPLRIFSTHEIPKGYEPIKIGPLDFGILQLEAPQHGLDLHLPGFMEKGETGDFEPRCRSPFKYFSLAGPAKNPVVIGVVSLRNLEFTYPLLDEESSRPTGSSSAQSSNPSILSYVTWELDIKAADRKVMYFRDISGNNTRLVRLLDATIDEGSSELRIRGRSNDNTFKLSGIIKSYHGSVYFGKTFNRNFEAGLEFVPQKKTSGIGYDNYPVIWGSAEAYSDTSRFDRIKLVAAVQDLATGNLSERGRLGKGRNVVFRLSSDFEELPGESEREFYRQAGLQFMTFGGAGKLMSNFGEQNLHRIFLQRFERKLAKFIGLDVISIETSIASNYFTRFYTRQIDNQTMQMQADYLALANSGLTVGRYLWSDMFFVKASGGLLPLDTALTPQYSIGLEFQPTRYLFMDFDYGFYKKELVIEHNPRINLQLRLPISGLRNFLDF
jgi:hypothetical protein